MIESKKILLFFFLLIFVACGSPIETNMSEQMMEFQFTTEKGTMLSLKDLEGEWWLANLVYTNCRTICPRTTTNMVHVQNRLKEDGVIPQIISFTIDPENDSPDILKIGRAHV